MDRIDYQMLRFSVENQVADFESGRIDSAALVNSVMRSFLQVVASTQIKQASGKRAFLTYRRHINSVPPSWAYRKPGISSRLPTL